MVAPVVEIEPFDTKCCATSSSAQRFSPADFSEAEAALFEADLADHVVPSRCDLAAPATESAR